MKLSDPHTVYLRDYQPPEFFIDTVDLSLSLFADHALVTSVMSLRRSTEASEQAKENFEERRYLYHKELVEDFFVAYRVESETSYRVKKGDTLWSLCHDEFELPFWLIKQYNAGFDFHAMRLGSEIKVPVVTEIDADSQVAEVIPVPPAGKSLAKKDAPPCSWPGTRKSDF